MLSASGRSHWNVLGMCLSRPNKQAPAALSGLQRHLGAPGVPSAAWRLLFNKYLVDVCIRDCLAQSSTSSQVITVSVCAGVVCLCSSADVVEYGSTNASSLDRLLLFCGTGEFSSVRLPSSTARHSSLARWSLDDSCSVSFYDSKISKKRLNRSSS